MGVGVALPSGREADPASWAPSAGVCLAPFALSVSPSCGAFWMRLFRASPLPDGDTEEAGRVWEEPGPSPSVVGFWGTAGGAEGVLS